LFVVADVVVFVVFVVVDVVLLLFGFLMLSKRMGDYTSCTAWYELYFASRLEDIL